VRLSKAAAVPTPQGPCAKPRLVPCPTCQGDSVFAPSNPYRPFCSLRCREIDLGAWADEGYRVAAKPDANDESPPEPSAPLQ
jgi:endogenous inhibitor of DNA gyrase (YacG/DUF329 family)